MNNLISVIVPVYNVQKYLPRCIESVLNQTYKNFELILVDDGSPDNCGAICDEYAKKDDRIKVIHKQNGGVSSARNAGIKIAQGEFINFIDSDDWIPNDSLENMINLQKENNVDLVCCTYERHLPNNKIVSVKFCDKFLNIEKVDHEEINILLSDLFRGPWTKLYKSSIIKVNNILFEENVKIGEDTIFVYSYLNKSKSIRCSNLIAYKYMINETSAMRSKHEDFYKYIIAVTQAKIKFFSFLNISETIKKGLYWRCIIGGIDDASHHYLEGFNYKKTIEVVSQFLKFFESFYIKNDKDTETVLVTLPNGRTCLTIYKLLWSFNGVKKYCTYTKFKIMLKKVKLINKLNNFIKGRK
ncbi:MAG: glycosyltransferase family 2 protein [Clostridia bacterium]|nr:glycosyltransferase family 2 protein [Clostridia bacterium]